MDDADEEARRLEELRQIKRRTLHELDKQAAQYTAALVPPHIQTERQRLRRELGIVEAVIASPLTATIGDDLGEASRFVAYIELMRQGDKATLEAVARLGEKVESFIEDQFKPFKAESMAWRWRITIIVLALVVIVLIAIIIGAYWIGRIGG